MESGEVEGGESLEIMGGRALGFDCWMAGRLGRRGGGEKRAWAEVAMEKVI